MQASGVIAPRDREHILSRRHPRKRVTQYSRGLNDKSMSRGVLATPHARGMTNACSTTPCLAEPAINPTVTSFLYALPTISRAPRGLGAASRVSCCVLGFWPRHCRWLLPPSSRAASCCRVRGPASRYQAPVQIAVLSWQAQHHVSFTGDPALATVRVQISDSAEAADFTVIDDIDSAEAGACESNAPPQLVAISSSPSASDPVIYLSKDGPADYRIFVRSKSFSARDAAALIVGARGGQHRLQAAAL